MIIRARKTLSLALRLAANPRSPKPAASPPSTRLPSWFDGWQSRGWSYRGEGGVSNAPSFFSPPPPAPASAPSSPPAAPHSAPVPEQAEKHEPDTPLQFDQDQSKREASSIQPAPRPELLQMRALRQQLEGLPHGKIYLDAPLEMKVSDRKGCRCTGRCQRPRRDTAGPYSGR